MKRPIYHCGGGLLVLLVPLVTMADTQTVTVMGELKTSTCEVRINGATADAIVALPPTTVAKLASVGNVDGKTGFTLNLTNCSSSGEVVPYFQNTQSTITPQGRLSNTASSNPANAVELQLLDSNSGVVNLSLDSSSQNAATPTAPTAGAVNFSFYIQYYATAAASAGAVSSALTYIINYL
ncbi:fimbrial protein [Pseudomonas sp. NPDC086251]|uniref:fimbrial protein n=1 Tax=Pseudomonas sp. NPDC086251 TaxID=3364431 RepID=UPI003837B504